MRMATPVSTWFNMIDCALSASSSDSSTPRLIGPGCMITASFFAREKIPLFRPYVREYSRIDGKYAVFCLSSWILSIITTSASRTASRMSFVTLAPPRAISLGRRVEGPQGQRSAPILPREWRLERTTLLWRISPIIDTLSPFIFPFALRMENRSRSPCVGCSFDPSPALMTEHETARDRKWDAPDDG